MKITVCFLVALLQIAVCTSSCPCPNPKPVANDIKYFLHTNSSNHSQIYPDNLDKVTFNPSNKLIFITHSFSYNSTDPFIQPLIVEIFKNDPDVNIVTVDWSKFNEIANNSNILDVVDRIYPLATLRTCCIGETVGESIVDIISAAETFPENCHLIGPSSGAHLMGCAAQFVSNELKKKIGRITGLDSSGPVFQEMSTECRLSADDAEFVDCYHTNDGFAGFEGNLGTVDVFVNGGKKQPLCRCDPDSGKLTYPHTFSWKIYTESVNNPVMAYRDLSCPRDDSEFDTNKCDIDDGTPVGYNIDETLTGNVNIETNSCPPYARLRENKCSEEEEDSSCPV